MHFSVSGLYDKQFIYHNEKVYLSVQFRREYLNYIFSLLSSVGLVVKRATLNPEEVSSNPEEVSSNPGAAPMITNIL